MWEPALVNFCASAPSLVKKETFAGVIEAAYGIDALGKIAEELHDSGAAFGIADGGDVAFGLVEKEIDETFCALDGFSIQTNYIRERVGFGALLGDYFAV